MKERIFSTVVIWSVVILSLLLFKAHAGVLLIALLAAFTQHELYRLFEKMGLSPRRELGIGFGVILILGTYYLPGRGAGVDAGYDLFTLGFILLTVVIILLDMREGKLRSFLPTVFGFILVPFMLHFLVKIVRVTELSGFSVGSGIFLAVWVVAVAKASDIGGLLLGMRFGKTKLAPTISPKKTVEGAIGGILSSAILGLLLLLIFQTIAPESFRWWQALLFPIPIAIAAIASDLVESAIKRQAGEKDSGKTIPGIGGAFDLTDSLLLSAPLAYILLSYSLF